MIINFAYFNRFMNSTNKLILITVIIGIFLFGCIGQSTNSNNDILNMSNSSIYTNPGDTNINNTNEDLGNNQNGGVENNDNGGSNGQNPFLSNSAVTTKWHGAFTVTQTINAAPTKTLSATMTSTDHLIYDPDSDELLVKTESYNCKSVESSDIQDPIMPVKSTSTGLGSYTKEYPPSDEQVRIIFSKDGGLGFYPDSNADDEWVHFSTTLNGQSMDSDGVCMMSMSVDFDLNEYTIGSDSEGNLRISGEKTIHKGTATLKFQFSYTEE